MKNHITIWLPTEIFNAVRKVKKDEGTPISAQIRVALKKELLGRGNK